MNTQDIKVSVIIPVYNTEKYLKQCLDSVCAQTLQEIEIICVDDGSTDSSPDILKDYASKDSRMRILKQKNQFAGAARNNGMKHAKGKYLMFWDADDFFEPDALQKMYNRMSEMDADVCICKANNYYTASDTLVHTDVLLNMKYVPDSDVFSFQTMGDDFFRFTSMAIWNKMVRREFLFKHEIEFPTLRNSEDVYFTAVELYLAERITVVDEYLVNYRKLDDSSLTFTTSQSAFSIIEAWTSAYERLKNENISGFERSFANRALASLIGVLHMTAEYPTFCSLVKKLKDGALESMGMKQPEDGYYYNSNYSDWLEQMIALSPEQFHAYFTLTTFRSQLEQIQNQKTRASRLRSELDDKNRELDDLKEQVRHKNDRIRRLGEQSRDQKERIREQKQMIQEQKDRIRNMRNRIQKQKSRIENLKQRLTEMEHSRSYQIGQVITWPSRKVSSVIKGDKRKQ